MADTPILTLKLLAQTPDAAGAVAPGSGSVFDLLGHSGPVVSLVLVVLLAFSVIGWAIIFFKARQLARAARDSDRFVEAFWAAKELSAVYESRKEYDASPIAAVFTAGYKELDRVLASRKGGDTEPVRLLESLGGVETIERAMHRTSSDQTTKLEAFVAFLATTGSTAPFIGLFGTVWGIMNSFHDISQMKSASIAVVAPGISEALIATAVGLAAAIPAVIAYNYFIRRITVLNGEMNNFVSDFLNLVENALRKRDNG